MNNAYPHVLDAATTIDYLHQGWSISRFGDGEFKLATGSPKNVSQVNSPALQAELSAILSGRSKYCKLAVPDMNPQLPKAKLWRKYIHEYGALLDKKEIYCSAFVTRPDSDPRINTQAYFDKVEALWRDKRVTLVGNGKRSLTKDFLIATGAKSVAFVECSYRDSYAQIDELEKEVMRIGLSRVILCGGAMATCLAWRLASKEMQGLDLGHIGMFWRDYAK